MKRQFPNASLIGLTATATSHVLKDAQKILCVDKCFTFTASFNRPNLYYEVCNSMSVYFVKDLEESFSSVQLLSHVWLSVTPWTAAHQASLSITNSRSLPKLMSIESVMPSNHLILLLSPSPALNLSQHQGLFKVYFFIMSVYMSHSYVQKFKKKLGEYKQIYSWMLPSYTLCCLILCLVK